MTIEHRQQTVVIVETDIPARLDRLPWTAFHTLVVLALGVSWVLDGLEVTLAGAVSGALKESARLHMSDAAVGLSASAYLAGAVLGAFLFGAATDRYGRKRLFFITLGLYLAATAATALSLNFTMFAIFRFLTGAGIGGEYAAINSAIQELVPARFRGQVDLLVNGSFWIGAASGALGAVVLLQPGRFAPDIGWRLAFGIGATLGLVILGLRRYVPESPRWLMLHGRLGEAESVVRDIERHADAPPSELPKLTLSLRSGRYGFAGLALSLLKQYPRRTLVCLLMMAAQAFFYNAIFFTYALVLERFFAVPSGRVGLYLVPFAAGNFLGPALLGRLFDHIGRRRMIGLTYVLSGLLLAASAACFNAGLFDAFTQTLAWSVIFFFASAAASSAYLTVGECFPLETRALTIALFYAAGTATGGIAGPALFAALIGTGQRDAIANGYVFGAVLMIVAGVVAWRYGVDAERRPLEEIARPLSQS